MNVDVLNHSVFIEDEECPFSVTLRPQNAVFLAHFTMRPEIAKEWILDSVEGVCPCFQDGNMVNTDAQNLGI